MPTKKNEARVMHFPKCMPFIIIASFPGFIEDKPGNEAMISFHLRPQHTLLLFMTTCWPDKTS